MCKRRESLKPDRMPPIPHTRARTCVNLVRGRMRHIHNNLDMEGEERRREYDLWEWKLVRIRNVRTGMHAHMGKGCAVEYACSWLPGRCRLLRHQLQRQTRLARKRDSPLFPRRPFMALPPPIKPPESWKRRRKGDALLGVCVPPTHQAIGKHHHNHPHENE